MTLRERFAGAAAALFRPKAVGQTNTIEIRELEQLIRDLNGGALSVSGEPVTVARAKQVAAVYSCVTAVAESIAPLPLVLLERRGDDRVPVRDDPLFSLLHDQPNEWQTSLEWRELMQWDLELRGNAYSQIIRGVGARVQELVRLHPDQVTPKQDDSLTVTYEVRRENGSRVLLDRSEVLHVRGPSEDGLLGLSPISLHRETLGDALATQHHGSRFFSNGARPLGTLEIEPTVQMGEEPRKAVRSDFDQLYSGTENAHKVAVLPPGMSFKPVSISGKDAQFIETRKFTRTEIAAIWRVPPHRIGDLERATFSNIEQQSLDFVIYSIVPRAKRWEQALKRDVLDGDPSRSFKHNVSALLRGDAKSRAEALAIQRQNGVINANEWRQLEDMNRRSDPGGDTYIVPMNMTTEDGGDGNDD